MQTEPENDPVQYVRQRFVSVLGRQPEPAAHFYWSDLLIRCGTDNACLTEQRNALSDYLESDPQQNFSISGNIEDEVGNPLSGARSEERRVGREGRSRVLWARDVLIAGKGSGMRG